jgi:hypothetical protein
MMRSEEEKKFYEAEKEKKRVERDRMLRFQKGKWNPGILDYLAEVHDRDIDFGYLDAPKIPTEKQIGMGSVVRMLSPEQEERLDANANDIEREFAASTDELKTFGLTGEERTRRNGLDMVENPDRTDRTEEKTFPLRPAESLVDVPMAQGELESIWRSLKLPLDQKLDMAIKYSSPKFSQKLEMVCLALI